MTHVEGNPKLDLLAAMRTNLRERTQLGCEMAVWHPQVGEYGVDRARQTLGGRMSECPERLSGLRERGAGD